MKKTIAIVALSLSLTACSGMSRQEQRALSGGVIGAGAGAGIAALTGGSILAGTVIGGAGGAAVGALTGRR